MSNVYQPKRKELAKVKVVSSGTYSANRNRYKFVGSVQRGYTAFVVTQKNRKSGKCSFVDDTSALTKRTKNEVVQFFSDKTNRNKGVAYLVVDKTAVVNNPTANNNRGKSPSPIVKQNNSSRLTSKSKGGSK